MGNRWTLGAAMVLMGCTASQETNNAADSATIGNRLIAPDDPNLAGMFNLGPDDYYTHSEKMGEAPSLVHSFVDWVDSESLAAAEADPTVRIEPIPIDELGMEIFDYAYSPGTIIALSWALPLPNYDVTNTAYPAIPRVQHILDGEYDDYIDDFAQAIGALDVPVMLTLFGEFDNNAFYAFGPEGRHGAAVDPGLSASQQVPVADDLTGAYGDPDVPDGPERVRDAFIYVIDRFRDAGVTNVSWYMYGSSGFRSVTTDNSEESQLIDALKWWNTPEHYYPGDDYIDWVGKSLHHNGLDDLQPKFEDAYAAWGAVTQRPFFSPEFSINEGFGVTSRDEIMREEFSSYFLSFSRFKAFATTDQDPTTGSAEFGLTTFGGLNGEFPGEITAWQEAVIENENWKTVPYTF
ncbi:MAG: hypothetical protein AAFV53_14765 [Myxococcota bacterium]